MRTMSPVPVVVLGEGVTALGVLRAFGRKGIPVHAPCSRKDPMRHSRFFRPLPGFVSADGRGLAADPAPLAEALQASGLERAVLCACSDHFCAAVAALPPALDERFPRCMPASATLDVLQDKGHFAELLARIGVAHPFTRLVRRPGDVDDIDGSRELFLKPRDSQRFFKTFGVKAFRVASAADARQRLGQTAAHDLEMVLQEYIPGSADNHYFVDGYRDRGGKVRVAFARRRLRIFPPDFGNSTAMVSIAPEEARQAIDDLDRLLAETGYLGIFSAEFKRDPRDGVYRILEVNTRPWWYVDFAVRSGADVCELMYRDALGEPLPALPPYEVGSRCVYPYYDLHALKHLRGQGMPYPWTRWARELWGAKQPIFALDDPLPGIYSALTTFGWLPKR